MYQVHGCCHLNRANRTRCVPHYKPWSVYTVLIMAYAWDTFVICPTSNKTMIHVWVLVFCLFCEKATLSRMFNCHKTLTQSNIRVIFVSTYLYSNIIPHTQNSSAQYKKECLELRGHVVSVVSVVRPKLCIIQRCFTYTVALDECILSMHRHTWGAHRHFATANSRKDTAWQPGVCTRV